MEIKLKARFWTQIHANNPRKDGTKTKTRCNIAFTNYDPKMQFRDLMNKHRTLMVIAVNDILNIMKQINI